MSPASRVIVPLDGISEAEALELAQRLEGHVWGFKVNDLLMQSGLRIITALKAHGHVFADPKLHDIPNTVANGVRRLADVGADLITIHASGGSAMVAAARAASADAKILAVTVLTSMTDADAQAVYTDSAADAVTRLASLAVEAGAHGVVSSPLELPQLAADPTTAAALKVTPGVRPSGYGVADDQRRTRTPAEAVEAGADLLVIGRPITGAADPVQAAVDINQSLNR